MHDTRNRNTQNKKGELCTDTNVIYETSNRTNHTLSSVFMENLSACLAKSSIFTFNRRKVPMSVPLCQHAVCSNNFMVSDLWCHVVFLELEVCVMSSSSPHVCCHFFLNFFTKSIQASKAASVFWRPAEWDVKQTSISWGETVNEDESDCVCVYYSNSYSRGSVSHTNYIWANPLHNNFFKGWVSVFS